MSSDRWISCEPDAIRVRGYYFPWGTKRIPYERIRTVERANIGLATGQARIWGTANPRYWASLDPRRPRKRQALILDVGGHIKPFLTPDDPDAVLVAIREHSNAAILAGVKGPVI